MFLKAFHLSTLRKSGCHGTKKGSVLVTLISKYHLNILGESLKVLKENFLLFQRYLSETTKEGETPQG